MRILKSSANSKGYLVNGLVRGGKTHSKHLHRLVIEHFGPPQPEGTECSHRDGDKSNCRAANLLWETHARNMRRQFDHGTDPTGERNPRSKVTAEQVLEIRAKRAAGTVLRLLSEEYGITMTAVHFICKGRNWKSHIPPIIDEVDGLPGENRVADALNG